MRKKPNRESIQTALRTHGQTRRAAFDAACALAALGQPIHLRALIERVKPHSDPVAIQHGLNDWLDANAHRGPCGPAPTGEASWVSPGEPTDPAIQADALLQDADTRLWVLRFQRRRLQNHRQQMGIRHPSESDCQPWLAPLQETLQESLQREIALIEGLEAVLTGLKDGLAQDLRRHQAMSRTVHDRTDPAPDRLGEPRQNCADRTNR
ncbi:hypothetical protein [Thiocystis minor]|uniref:hypothetical protein n=1 Tax=Thiocystis minor TaxID=61597 RepID=UPI0019129BFC|nr:hypothetical protein [Thiocystis minor]